MHVKDYYKTLNISLLFWHQNFTNIFTSKLILPMVLPVNRWYGKSSKFTTLPVHVWITHFWTSKCKESHAKARVIFQVKTLAKTFSVESLPQEIEERAEAERDREAEKAARDVVYEWRLDSVTLKIDFRGRERMASEVNVIAWWPQEPGGHRRLRSEVSARLLSFISHGPWANSYELWLNTKMDMISAIHSR